MKSRAVLLAATLPLIGLNCGGPPIKTQERATPTQIRSAESQAQTTSATRQDQAVTSSDSRADDELVSPAKLDSAAKLSPTVPQTPLEIMFGELAAELRLKEEHDAARRAVLQAEIVKLREQRQFLYAPSVKD